MTVSSTEGHGKVRKLVFLLHLCLHKDLLKASVGFHSPDHQKGLEMSFDVQEE
jgi:hypothetical protein